MLFKWILVKQPVDSPGNIPSKFSLKQKQRLQKQTLVHDQNNAKEIFTFFFFIICIANIRNQKASKTREMFKLSLTHARYIIESATFHDIS